MGRRRTLKVVYSKQARLKEKVRRIGFPAEKVAGAGWLNETWWSNGGYSFTYEGREFWHLCLERKGRENVGYNAVVRVVDGTAKGVVLTDRDYYGLGCTPQDLAELA